MKHAGPPALRHLADDLRRLERDGLLRQRSTETSGGRAWASNDYLGLAGGERPPVGAGASRLLTGDRPEHRELEDALARWVGAEASLLFTSGFAANAGLVPALAWRPEDRILSDELNHASLVDGCRLARARTEVLPHLDLDALRARLEMSCEGRTWVVSESYFSMDADSPDLRALRTLCDEHDAGLILDEAHALGVLGPDGRGLAAEAGVVPDVLVGTLGKAFGTGGAFVAGCGDLVAWLWNRARTFVFSTGLSPLLAVRSLDALTAVQRGAGLRAAVLARAEELRTGLLALGLRVPGHGHIVPWVVGGTERALWLAAELRRRGFAVRAIRPPTVPVGTARLRLTVSSRHSEEDVGDLLAAVAATLASEPRQGFT